MVEAPQRFTTLGCRSEELAGFVGSVFHTSVWSLVISSTCFQQALYQHLSRPALGPFPSASVMH